MLLLFKKDGTLVNDRQTSSLFPEGRPLTENEKLMVDAGELIEYRFNSFENREFTRKISGAENVRAIFDENMHVVDLEITESQPEPPIPDKLTVLETELQALKEENTKLKTENDALKQRDSALQDDVLFIMETLAGNGLA